MKAIPEVLPLDVSLLEDPVIGVDHSRSQNGQEHDENSELVECPEHVSGNVRHLFFNVVLEMTFSAALDLI